MEVQWENQIVRPTLVEACVCKEAVMITVRLQCLVPRRFGVEDANYDGRLLLPILRHEKWVILHVRNCPPFLLLRVKERERRVAVRRRCQCCFFYCLLFS